MPGRNSGRKLDYLFKHLQSATQPDRDLISGTLLPRVLLGRSQWIFSGADVLEKQDPDDGASSRWYRESEEEEEGEEERGRKSRVNCERSPFAV